MAYSRSLYLFMVVLMIICGGVKSRWLEIEISGEVTEIKNVVNQQNDVHDPFARCKSIYWFLPCANTVKEGILLVGIYTYALTLGEKWLNTGNEALFMHLPYEKSAGFLFRLIKALPRVSTVVVSGVMGALSTQSDARDQVAFAVAMYAGSTLISLTALWGLHVYLYREELPRDPKTPQDSSSTRSQKCSAYGCLRFHGEEHPIISQDSPSTASQKCSLYGGFWFLPFFLRCSKKCSTHGVPTQDETRKMASILLLSMIPFTIVLLVQVCNHRVMILMSLIVTILTGCFYLLYQIAYPWILNTSVAYLKEDQLQIMFLVKLGWLVDEDLYINGGEPNENAIRSIFQSLDTDKDKSLGVNELNKFLGKLTNGKISEEYASQEILRHFDTDKDGNISDKEFIDGCTRWLKKWNANQNLIGLSSVPSLCEKFVRDSFIGNEYEETDRKLDTKIEELFKEFDVDKDGKLNIDELQKLVQKIFKLAKQDHGKLFAESMMKDLDKDKSGHICKNEIKEGLKFLIDSIIRKTEDKKLQELFDRFDVNKDKELNDDELEKMIMDTLNLDDQHQRKLFAQSIMKHFDVNKSGRISKSEVKTKLKYVSESLIGKKNEETEENEKLQELFNRFDVDKDGALNIDELEKMIVDTFKLSDQDQGKLFAESMMTHFNTNKPGKISKSELKTGLNKWKETENHDDQLQYFQCLAIRALGIVDTKETPKTKILFLLIGAATIFLFTGPFVQSVIRLSEALHLPFYFSSFFVAPLIIKTRSILIFRFSCFLRGNYTNKSGSLTFFELYAELVMNNIMGLTMILAVVYLQGLTWDYTPEVVTIIVTGLLMGTFARTRETYPLWTCFPSFFLYVTITVIFCLYTSKWA